MNIRKWRKGDALKCVHGDGDLKELFGRKDGLYTFHKYHNWHSRYACSPSWIQVKETELSYPIDYFEFIERRDELPIKPTNPILLKGFLMGVAASVIMAIFIFSLIYR